MLNFSFIPNFLSASYSVFLQSLAEAILPTVAERITHTTKMPAHTAIPHPPKGIMSPLPRKLTVKIYAVRAIAVESAKKPNFISVTPADMQIRSSGKNGRNIIRINGIFPFFPKTAAYLSTFSRSNSQYNNLFPNFLPRKKHVIDPTKVAVALTANEIHDP